MEGNLKTRLEKLGVSVLNASRSDLYLSMRFLDIALSALGYRMYLGIRTVATDGIDILYHPRYLVERYQDDPVLVNRMYLHMVLHCMFRHMLHYSEYEPEYWNIACDIAVESIIDSLDSKAIALTVSDERQEVYDQLKTELKVLTAEGIYRVLKRKQLTYEELIQLKREFTVCDHSIWEKLQEKESEGKEQSSNQNQDQADQDQEDQNQEDQNQEDQDQENQIQENQNQEDQNQEEEQNEDTKGQEKENSEQAKKQMQELMQKQQKEELDENWTEISEKTQTSLETFAKSVGAEFSGLTKALKSLNRTRYDYKEFLRKFAVRREVMKEDQDEFDYGYYTYGMRLYKNMPLIEPLEYKEEKQIEEFVIVIDTSGSCSGELVKTFLSESFSILSNQETFAKKVNVHIIQCDDQVQSAVRITNQEELLAYENQLEIKGLGSTDFRPAIEYVNELIRTQEIRSLKGLLYFTDGYGIYPNKRPAYDVAFVFVGEEYSDANVQPWAMKLVIEAGGNAE